MHATQNDWTFDHNRPFAINIVVPSDGARTLLSAFSNPQCDAATENLQPIETIARGRTAVCNGNCSTRMPATVLKVFRHLTVNLLINVRFNWFWSAAQKAVADAASSRIKLSSVVRGPSLQCQWSTAHCQRQQPYIRLTLNGVMEIRAYDRSCQ